MQIKVQWQETTGFGISCISPWMKYGYEWPSVDSKIQQ